MALGVRQYHRVPVRAACKGGVVYLLLSIYITLFSGAKNKPLTKLMGAAAYLK